LLYPDENYLFSMENAEFAEVVLDAEHAGFRKRAYCHGQYATH
jgi:hypothetical protein